MSIGRDSYLTNAAEDRENAERERALERRLEAVAEQRTRVLQLEADVVELTKEYEVQERIVHDRRRAVDERLARQREDAVNSDERLRSRLGQLRADKDKYEAQLLDIESGWRRLEDAITAHDANFDAEQRRLQQAIKDGDEAIEHMRNRQRQLNDREQEVESRRRQLHYRGQKLRDMDRTAAERLQAEINEREAMLLAPA